MTFKYWHCVFEHFWCLISSTADMDGFSNAAEACGDSCWSTLKKRNFKRESCQCETCNAEDFRQRCQILQLPLLPGSVTTHEKDISVHWKCKLQSSSKCVHQIKKTRVDLQVGKQKIKTFYQRRFASSCLHCVLLCVCVCLLYINNHIYKLEIRE